MKSTTSTLALLATILILQISTVTAGADMIIDFPGILRPRASAVPAASNVNLLAFSSALGGAAAEPVTTTGDAKNPFLVAGVPQPDFKTAAIRSCNDQHNACAGVAHGSTPNGLTVGQCDTQQTQCEAAAAAGPSSNSNSNSDTDTSNSGASAAVASASAAAQTEQETSSAFVSAASVSVAEATSTSSAFAVQGLSANIGEL
ncbi:hypothetical protein EG329_011924 [Mollisiaceae sp. DMI_Dod_QoI]|nr:hypothetical protein EG329_011924 [Helotiales sp. DMI_Dod_QoI]